MEQGKARRIRFAKTAGGAEAALISVKSLRLDVDTRFGDEDFGTPLAVELEAITARLEEIHGDLDSLAHATDPDVGWELEMHRLANRGAEPAATTPEHRYGACGVTGCADCKPGYRDGEPVEEAPTPA